MSSVGYHEPVEELSDETRDMHRAIVSLMEELEAVDWYDQRAKATTDVQREYSRVYNDPANIHGMCEDYRASASIDLKHDEASWSQKVQCPLLTLWGLKGPMGRIYDVLGVWKERGVTVAGKGLAAGLAIVLLGTILDRTTAAASRRIGRVSE